MRGMKLNKADEESPKYRFKFLELVREDVIRLRAETPPDDIPNSIAYIGYVDLATTGVFINLAGSATDVDETGPLFEAVRDEIVRARRDNEDGEILQDAPATIRVLGVAHVLGARDMEAQMRGTESGDTVAEGYLTYIAYTDMSTAFFVGQANGEVNLVGCSAELGYVDTYLVSHPVDNKDIDLQGLKMQPGDVRPIEVELGLTISTLTATLPELAMIH